MSIRMQRIACEQISKAPSTALPSTMLVHTRSLRSSTVFRLVFQIHLLHVSDGARHKGLMVWDHPWSPCQDACMHVWMSSVYVCMLGSQGRDTEYIHTDGSTVGTSSR